MGSHSDTCPPAEVTFPPLPQPKLVLDFEWMQGKVDLGGGYIPKIARKIPQQITGSAVTGIRNHFIHYTTEPPEQERKGKNTKLSCNYIKSRIDYKPAYVTMITAN